MKLPFDKIYCLHLAESPERLNSSKEEFIKMGIYDDVDYWWTCRHPNSAEIANFLINNNKFFCCINNYEHCGNAYNCVRNWYEIIKTSYLRGFEHILCIEDDIKFNVSKDEFETFMRQIPNDYEIIRFGYNVGYNVENNIFNNNEHLYIQDYNNFIPGTIMFALNRNGMKYYIDYIDEYFSVADWPFYCVDYINLKCITNYFTSKNFYDLKYNGIIKSEIITN